LQPGSGLLALPRQRNELQLLACRIAQRGQGAGPGGGERGLPGAYEGLLGRDVGELDQTIRARCGAAVHKVLRELEEALHGPDLETQLTVVGVEGLAVLAGPEVAGVEGEGAARAVG